MLKKKTAKFSSCFMANILEGKFNARRYTYGYYFIYELVYGE